MCLIPTHTDAHNITTKKKLQNYQLHLTWFLSSASGKANKASLWKVSFIPGCTCFILGVRGGSCFFVWARWHLEILRASCISIFLHCPIYNFLAFYLEGSKQLQKLVLQKLFTQEFPLEFPLEFPRLNTSLSAFIFLELSATRQLSLLSCLFTWQLKPFALLFLILAKVNPASKFFWDDKCIYEHNTGQLYKIGFCLQVACVGFKLGFKYLDAKNSYVKGAYNYINNVRFLHNT